MSNSSTDLRTAIVELLNIVHIKMTKSIPLTYSAIQPFTKAFFYSNNRSILTSQVHWVMHERLEIVWAKGLTVGTFFVMLFHPEQVIF